MKHFLLIFYSVLMAYFCSYAAMGSFNEALSTTELPGSCLPQPLSDDVNGDKDYGVHTIDGVTYRLYSHYGRLWADVLPLNGFEDYKGDLYIPDYVVYEDLRFDIGHFPCFDQDNDELVSFSVALKKRDVWLYDLPNLKTLELREGTIYSPLIFDCPSLQSLDFPSSCKLIGHVTECPGLTTMTFKNKTGMILTGSQSWSFGHLWSEEFLPSLTDVYFTGEYPPVVNTDAYDLLPNTKVKVHIPKGAKDTYGCSGWDSWNLIEDQPEIPEYVPWDYCGNIVDQTDTGILVGCGDNDMEYAMRIPAKMLAPYLNCKITAIELLYGQDRDPEYVFLTTPGTDYLVKEPTESTPWLWTRVNLPDPYLITDQDLFVGIGRHGSLGVAWASDEVVEDGMWARNMGTDRNPLLFAQPGIWKKNLGVKDWNHPIPIRAIIEGDSLVKDVLIIGADVSDDGESQSYIPECPGKVLSSPLNSKTNDTGYFVSEINNNDDRQTKVNDVMEDHCKPKRLSLGDKKLNIKIRNRCPHVVKNVTLEWELDEEMQDPILIDAGIPKNTDYQVTIGLPDGVSGKRHHNIKVRVKDIDGIPDGFADNSDIDKVIVTSGSLWYPRKFVMEEATGTWCGYCPRGLVTIERMKERYPENFIAIAVHDDEEMSMLDDSYRPFLDRVHVFPSAMLNRTEWIDLYPFELDSAIGSAEAMVKSSAYFADGNTVEVATETTFGFDDSGEDHFAVSYVVVEDGVGPHLQNNNFSDSDSVDVIEGYLNWWTLQQDVVPYIYDDVARSIQDYHGIKGLLPNNIMAGATYRNTYLLSLPDNFDKSENLRIVTLLIDSITGEILNADSTDVEGSYDSVSEFMADEDIRISIVDKSLIIENAVGREVSVSSMDGVLLKRVKCASHFEKLSMDSGLFLVKVGDSTKKILIS